MTELKLICAGRLKESFFIEACREYEKRLKPICPLEIIEIPEQSQKPNGLQLEGEKILSLVPGGAYVVAMCIEGKSMDSVTLAKTVEQAAVSGYSRLCVIIGSSEGLSPAVKNHAHLRLSMSKMTFPHHLARVMVLEQFYRAFSIIKGTKYHK